MPRSLPKGVHVETSRHGTVAHYYRANRGRRIRLPDDIGSDHFREAVRLAATAGQAMSRPARETARDARRRLVGLDLSKGLKRAHQRAKHKGHLFDIDLAWAIARAEEQDFRCALTLIPFYYGARSGRCDPYAPSFDRIDCRLGYTKDNVRIVVHAVNVMLCDWGPQVLERVAVSYLTHKRRTAIPSP